ncbi:MAG: hypothetical protein A2046_03855 [Bacteroidetes bacterium GWA2_30_7]|nr:MAG: hypothetical protein A2046_03855 [Bacteroidetes bacterium GWA2_30_7]
MKELVRCRPCGFVIEADKLGDVCPACGMPRKVFEPYRERVSANRKTILAFDLHPIAIHLSQTFVVLIPIMILLKMIFPDFYPEVIFNVLIFAITIFPFTLILAIISGVIDGLTRFKTLLSPLLKIKIIFSTLILILSAVVFFFAKYDNYGFDTLLLSLASLACAVRLGLWGKKLLEVILPGTYPLKRGNKTKKSESQKLTEKDISPN